MTAPVSHGFPDWGRSISAADIEIFNSSPVLAGGLNSLGTFFVGNLPDVQLVVAVDAGGAKVDMAWTTDSTGATIIARNSIHVRVSQDGHGSLAVLGPYVKIEATPDAAGRTLTLRVFQTLVQGSDTRWLPTNQLLSIDLVPIVSGVTTSFDATAVRWGWGYWHARFEAATAYRMRLQAFDYLGVARMLDFVANGEDSGGRVIMLPAMPLRIQALQVDGVNRDLFGTILYGIGPT